MDSLLMILYELGYMGLGLLFTVGVCIFIGSILVFIASPILLISNWINCPILNIDSYLIFMGWMLSIFLIIGLYNIFKRFDDGYSSSNNSYCDHSRDWPFPD